MKHPGSRLPFLMMTMLAPWGACALEDPTPGAAEAQEDQIEAAARDQAVHTVAEVLVPTEDGQAAYRFRIDRVDDGVMLTTIESPLGYPVPQVPTECALDTFLRVAPEDSVVPAALIEHCLSPDERAIFGLPGEGEGSVQVAAVKEPGSTLEFTQESEEALCNVESFQERAGDLQDLAAYVPTISYGCESPCIQSVAWDLTSCIFLDEYGNFDGYCNDIEHQFLIDNYGPSGGGCMAHGPPVCSEGPDPWCAHDWRVLADWGPWVEWQRTTHEDSHTTRVRAEISSCGPNGTTGWWRMKREASDPWGAEHALFWPAGTHTVHVLSAGWDTNDAWRGFDFQVHADGSGFHAIFAWVKMEGRDRFRCPIQL